jgi:hypothetical protein
LADRQLSFSNSRGDPKNVTAVNMAVPRPERAEALKAFCRKWGIETDDEPQWWLSSYWG